MTGPPTGGGCDEAFITSASKSPGELSSTMLVVLVEGRGGREVAQSLAHPRRGGEAAREGSRERREGGARESIATRRFQK